MTFSIYPQGPFDRSYSLGGNSTALNRIDWTKDGEVVLTKDRIFGIVIGQYASAQRAKEIAEDIADNYNKWCKWSAHCKQPVTIEEMLSRVRAGIKPAYRLPEE